MMSSIALSRDIAVAKALPRATFKRRSLFAILTTRFAIAGSLVAILIVALLPSGRASESKQPAGLQSASRPPMETRVSFAIDAPSMPFAASPRVVLGSPFGDLPLRTGNALPEKQTGRIESSSAAPSEPVSAGMAKVRPGRTLSGRVDLNTASREAIDALGGKLGRSIVSARPYRSPDDLVSRRVISRTAYLRIKDQVTVRQP